MPAKPAPVPIEDQVACVAREVALRKNVYRKRVEAGQMDPEEARAELARMEAVGRTLLAVKEAEPLALGLLGAIGFDVVGGTTDDAAAGEEAPADDRAGAGLLEAFEEQARSVDLRGDGLRQLLTAYGATRISDLSPRQLEEATGAIATEDAAQGFNADGFVRTAVESIRTAPERHRARVHEQATERAGERFGRPEDGELLARVRLALDKAAGMPLPPEATGEAKGSPAQA